MRMDPTFMAYANHETEKERIIKKLVNSYFATGETSFNISSKYTSLSEGDIAYIKREAERRIEARLSKY